MQTIETTYHGATNTRGARIRAKASGGHALTISYPHDATNDTDPHIKAALALCAELNWRGRLVFGHTRRGMVAVFIDDQAPTVDIPAKA